MDIYFPKGGRDFRTVSLDFDFDGPRIGSAPLLLKTRTGFSPRHRKDLEELLKKQLGGVRDSARLYERLSAIARMLNAGDVALAAIATSQLRVQITGMASPATGSLQKASPDDPVRPGWPAKTPGGRGGKFRPKTIDVALDPAREAERLARLERLEARRGIRSALRRVLSAKRVARLLLEGIGEMIPGLDALDTAALIEDVSEIAAELEETDVNVEAAKAFVEEGPRTLEDLTMGEEDESFSSFLEYKKIDLIKRFGVAGDGYEYHHIVEQGADFTQEQLQATSNIVRIPKLLHEEVDAEFARSNEELGGLSLRESLKGTSFEEQRAAGLDVLRKLGILYP